ncbi:unnamed protein product [Rotaria magnacalcarata]
MMTCISEVETAIELEMNAIENSVILFHGNVTNRANQALTHMQSARENMMMVQPTTVATLKFSATSRWNMLQIHRSTADIDLNHRICLPIFNETMMDEKISIDAKENDFAEESNTQQIEHKVLLNRAN